MSILVRCNVLRLTRTSLRISGLTSRSMASTLQKEKTFQYQASLPSLPVPSLNQTCQKYLESVKPFLTDEEYLQTDFLVNEFKNGIGKDLQKILLQRGNERRNWLVQWWEEEGYLRPRYPLSPFINIGGPANTDIWPAEEGTQIKRSAFFVHALLKIWQQIYREEVDIQKLAGKPLCMDQYTRFFASCRVPGKELDEFKNHFRPAPAPSCRHIVVQSKGRFFYCEVLDEKYEPFTPPEIERSLSQIKEITDRKSYGPALGSLTGEDRHIWYKFRERLQSLHANNARYLYDIDKALFMLVLDDNDAKTEDEIAYHSVCGDSRNRWFDKSYSVLAFKSGLFGTHGDHVPCEGVVNIDIIKQALTGIVQQSKGEWQGRLDIQNSIAPHELDFVVDNQLTKAVDVATKKYREVADKLHFIVCHFNEYGKNFSKSQRVHPDVFCQMMIQLTYYRIHKKPGATYESAQTRLFYHGRTDTMRSCTTEAVNWCKAMLDPEQDANMKAQLFHMACSKHSQLMLEALNGQAIDRHFLGLGVIARDQGYPTPQIFLDKAWAKSGGGANFVLSTSCVGFSEFIGLCAPMVHDGYGVFYSIEDTRFNVVIAGWKDSNVTDINKFRDEFALSLQEIRQVLLSAKL